MHKTLIIKAFEEASEKLETEGVKKPSNLQKAILIKDYLENDCKVFISRKSLDNYNKKAKNQEISNEENIIFQKDVIQGLCNFIGFESYDAFLHSNLPPAKSSFLSRSKSKTLITISIILLAVLSLTLFLNNYIREDQKWMIWNLDHYEEVQFDPELLKNGFLKLYKEDRIKNFSKVNSDCNTIFFNTKGEVNIWYGKNEKGELECFSSHGLHPETGKTLKPITKYMIKKYICETF